jgi:hypothetical protein
MRRAQVQDGKTTAPNERRTARGLDALRLPQLIVSGDWGRKLADVIDFNSHREARRAAHGAIARTEALDAVGDERLAFESLAVTIGFTDEADIRPVWHAAPMPSARPPRREKGRCGRACSLGRSILDVVLDSVADAWFGLLFQRRRN